MKYKAGILFIAIMLIFTHYGHSQHYMYSSDEIKKFGRLFNWVTNYYVDSVNQEKLTVSAIKGVLKELDPHSTYISKEEVEALNQSLKGSFEGIGIQFNILNDTILVVSTISGGPAEEVGMRAGDRIIYVEGEKVAGTGVTNKGVRERLMGEKGSEVQVKIQRHGHDALLQFTIERDKIPLESMDASYMLDKQTGYIKLNRFSATTVEEFKKGLRKLRKKGLQNLVLDLTGNGGGYLKTANNLASQFLEDDQLIVYTNGTNVEREDYRAGGEGMFKKGRLVVLIDEGSASASEIVTGAMQDWDRGVVIGRRSFGKGLVQQPLRFRDNSMVRLTIARYYTPTGRLIQKPYNNGVKEYRKEIKKRIEHGEMYHVDSIDFPDSLKYLTKVNKRTVYGGGGIMPDIFVPADTTEYSDFYRDVVSKGILNDFILTYTDNHREMLNKRYPDFDAFRKNFEVPDDLYNKLIARAKDEGVAYSKEEHVASGKMLKVQMKALMARDLWNTNEYFQIVNQLDDMVDKALEVLQNLTIYNKILEGSYESYTTEQAEKQK